MTQQESDMTAKEMVVHLIDHREMSPQDISEAMGGRISSRTIYRWARGESLPQRGADRKALEEVYTARSA
jgi:hypothetical protein